MLGVIFVIDVGDFTCLAGEREKKCPGGRLPPNAGELEALDGLMISCTLSLLSMCVSSSVSSVAWRTVWGS